MAEKERDKSKESTADKNLNLIRAGFLIAGIAMIIYGATHGEAAIVLRKAVMVCLECIGLG